MGSAVFLYENFADQAILDGGSYQSALPRTNMQDSDIGRVARTTNAQVSSTVINVDLGQPQAVGGIALGPTNISPGASWRIRSYSNAAFSVVSYDSGVQSVGGSVADSLDLEWENPGFWEGNPNYTESDNLPVFVFHVIPLASQPLALSQWWRIEIFDEGNSDGYLDIGRLLISRTWQPSVNYSYGDNPLTLEPIVDVSETLGGRKDFWDRGRRRVWRCSFPMLPETEVFSDVLRIMLRSRVSQQIFVVPDPNDAAYGQRRSFLGRFRQVPAIQQIQYGLGSTAFDIEEDL